MRVKFYAPFDRFVGSQYWVVEPSKVGTVRDLLRLAASIWPDFGKYSELDDADLRRVLIVSAGGRILGTSEVCPQEGEVLFLPPMDGG